MYNKWIDYIEKNAKTFRVPFEEAKRIFYEQVELQQKYDNSVSESERLGNFIRALNSFAQDYRLFKLKKEKQYDEAIKILESELRIDRSAPPAVYKDLAILYRKKKLYKKEVKLLEFYLERKPNDDYFENRLIRAKELQNKVDSDKYKKNIINKYINSREIKYKKKNKDRYIDNNIKQLEDKYDYYNNSTEFKNVPEFNPGPYEPDGEDITEEIINFYNIWKKNWKENKPIQLKGNCGYLKHYLYEIVTDLRQRHREYSINVKKWSPRGCVLL